MPTCIVCGSADFVSDSGFYFCVECQTQSQDVRVVMDDGDGGEENEDFSAGQDPQASKLNTSTSLFVEEETLTIWEGFNYALIGLVDELIKIGAKPELRLIVLQLWSKYLARMEVAFFSNEMALPKLGPNFRKMDAKLIHGHSYKRQTKDKKKYFDLKNAEPVLSDSQNDVGVKKRILKTAKKAYMHQTYEKALLEMAASSQTLTNMTLDMLSTEQPDEEEKSEESNTGNTKPIWISHHPGLLLRNRLIAFLYLGILVCEDNIKLSDLLRWVTNGNLSYNSLQKFFPGITTCGIENSTIFFKYQPSPNYSTMLKVTFFLAKYLQFQSLKLLAPQDLIQHYIKELNLSAQVGLVARRLLGVLPTLPDHFDLWSTSDNALPNVEARAMSHVVIAMKLIFALDDCTEHHNSNIARNINELLKLKRESSKLFVLDDWDRYCTLRRTAFSLFHFPSYMKHNAEAGLSTIQNATPTLFQCAENRPDSEKDGYRRKIMKQTVLTFLDKIEQNENRQKKGDTSAILFPASTAPYTSCVEAIVSGCTKSSIAVDDGEWGCMVQNFPYQKLSVEFKDTSIEYLTHPERFVLWAQVHGLPVGLHSGSRVSSIIVNNHASQSCESFSDRRIRNRPYRVKVILDKEFVNFEPEKPLSTTYLREYKYQKALFLPSSKSNGNSEETHWPVIDDMQSDSTTKTSSCAKRKRSTKNKSRTYYDKVPDKAKKKMLYFSHTEYWTSNGCYPKNNSAWWESQKKSIPSSFERLLEECAFLIEVKPVELYQEVLNVEALHEDLFPSPSKQLSECPAHPDHTMKLKKWWCQ